MELFYLLVAIIGIPSALLGAYQTYRFLRRVGDPQLAAIERQAKAILDTLQQGALTPPPGAAPVDTNALAAQATRRAMQLLTEAVELQRQHKEHAAIECLLTAYNRDLPAEAKSQLHILAGNGFLRLSELEEAEGHYRQGLDAAEEGRDRVWQAAALGNLGIVYGQRGDLAKAEEHHKRGLAIHEEIGNRVGQANQLGNLGLVYFQRDELDRAEEHHKKALAIDEEIGNRFGQAQDLGNLGLVYAHRGELAKAEEHYNKTLAIHEKIGNRLGQAQDLGNLGNVYLERGELDKAEKHYRKALGIHEEIGNRLGEAETFGNLGLLAAMRGDAAKARSILNQAKALYEAIGAGGPNLEVIRHALARLEAPGPPQAKPKPKRARKKGPPKRS